MIQKRVQSNIQWSTHLFSELSTRELYQLMRLRFDVFVIEQKCLYEELDGLDCLPDTVHILGKVDESVVAYARMMAPEQETPVVKIGRVVVEREFRGKGIARHMMQELLGNAARLWPGVPVGLSAQTQVSAFYQSLDFLPISAEYREDGIAHIDMLRTVGHPRESGDGSS